MTTVTLDSRHGARAHERRRLTDLAARHAHWLPGVAFASVFLFQGARKLGHPAGFAKMMSLPLAAAWLVTFAELAAGLGVLVGPLLQRDWITRLAGLAIVPVMLGAIAMVHWGQWSFGATESHPMGAMELQVVVLLLMGLWLAAFGNRSA